MPKERANLANKEVSWAAPKFEGKTFVFFKMEPRAHEEARRRVETEHGTVVDKLTEKVDFLVWGEWDSETIELFKQLDQWNQQGASIQNANVPTFFALFTPNRQQAFAILAGGAKGAKRWKELCPDGPDAHLDLKRIDLPNAKLKGLVLSRINFLGANFKGAMLRKSVLDYCNLKKSILKEAILQQASLCHTDLRGADLSGADLTDAKFAETRFDEHTKFPKGFKPPKGLIWAGTGPDPRTVKKMRKPTGPLNAETFMKELEKHTDAAKLSKALAMLKADRFKLYSQVADDFLAGVVKSQNDPNLVYSCRLAADGAYACCTQNLNICGGLRGSLCKHLLVLIVGLSKSGELDPTQVYEWIEASRLQKPVLDKDVMSETFLRYKGAEAGEVDWRPTETIPEDYYAM